MEKTPAFSVSDFIAVTNQTLEYAYPSVVIEGEVSGFKVNQGKFVFFDLKDVQASVGCFMMAFQLRMPIEDGMKVVVVAQPKLTNWGKFSLTVKSIRPSGEGSLKKSFEILRAKLENEGLFNDERKRTLPRVPTHVGVISSTQAAGYADFVKILDDRWGGLELQVAQVQVQGEAAPDQIIRAIEYFNSLERPPEVLALIRGGGSADDLSAFNDERLVRAIAASRVPTLVGVGHETDESLADMVADRRASTPSNAAQILVPDKAEVQRSVRYQMRSLIPKIQSVVEKQVLGARELVFYALTRIEDKVKMHEDQIGQSKKVLAQLNPEVVLRRGYALLRGEAKVGSTIEIETIRAIIKAEVKDVRSK